MRIDCILAGRERGNCRAMHQKSAAALAKALFVSPGASLRSDGKVNEIIHSKCQGA